MKRSRATSIVIARAIRRGDGPEKSGIFFEISLDSFPGHHPQLSLGTWSMVSDHHGRRTESSSAPLPEHPGEWM